MAFIGKITSITLGYILATGLTIGGTLTDFMDGKSARKHNSNSEFGKKLDILADKVFAFMIGISLSLINPLFLFNILGEALISFSNIYYQAKYNNIESNSSFIGKVKQWPLSVSFILGYLSIFLPQISIITSVFIFTTFIFQLVVFKDYLNLNHKQIINNINQEKTTLLSNKKKNDQETLSKAIQNKEYLKREYTKLRDVLLQIQALKSNNGNTENYVKVKK